MDSPVAFVWRVVVVLFTVCNSISFGIPDLSSENVFLKSSLYDYNTVWTQFHTYSRIGSGLHIEITYKYMYMHHHYITSYL